MKYLILTDRWIYMMHTRVYRTILYLVCLSLAFAWLGGCAALDEYRPAEPLTLTAAEKDRIGVSVEVRLIQMLGGPYYDKTLNKDLNRFVRSAQPFKISVADRSASAIYPLPGGRAIVTRGLLGEVRSRAELESLLAQALRLSENLYTDRVVRGMAKATTEALSVSSSLYDPDSATIRLARLFEQDLCERDCLMSARQTGNPDSADLPESVKRLHALQPGYALLAEALDLEKLDDQAKAVATYLQAAATTPDEPRILGSLGLAYLRVGQLQPARLHLQKSVELQPDYYRTQMGLGYLYLQMGNFNQANQALASSVRLLPVTENLFLLAETREKNGDVAGAMSLYRLVVESDPASKLGRTAASRLSQSAAVQ